jgi:phage gpG-like protein
MAGFIKISIDGDERLIAKFKAIEFYFNKKLNKPLKRSGDLLLKRFDENFTKEGKELNKPWKKLAASTLRQKAKLGFGSKGILVRTGNLRRGFEKKVKKFSVRVFNDISYYKYHQLGGSRLPKRVMIRGTENIKQDIVEIFRKDLNQILMK